MICQKGIEAALKNVENKGTSVKQRKRLERNPNLKLWIQSLKQLGSRIWDRIQQELILIIKSTPILHNQTLYYYPIPWTILLTFTIA